MKLRHIVYLGLLVMGALFALHLARQHGGMAGVKQQFGIG